MQYDENRIIRTKEEFRAALLKEIQKKKQKEQEQERRDNNGKSQDKRR